MRTEEAKERTGETASARLHGLSPCTASVCTRSPIEHPRDELTAYDRQDEAPAEDILTGFGEEHVRGEVSVGFRVRRQASACSPGVSDVGARFCTRPFASVRRRPMYRTTGIHLCFTRMTLFRLLQQYLRHETWHIQVEKCVQHIYTDPFDIHPCDLRPRPEFRQTGRPVTRDRSAVE